MSHSIDEPRIRVGWQDGAVLIGGWASTDPIEGPPRFQLSLSPEDARALALDILTEVRERTGGDA